MDPTEFRPYDLEVISELMEGAGALEVDPERCEVLSCEGLAITMVSKLHNCKGPTNHHAFSEFYSART